VAVLDAVGSKWNFVANAAIRIANIAHRQPCYFANTQACHCCQQEHYAIALCV
jgi:hypothetical protein